MLYFSYGQLIGVGLNATEMVSGSSAPYRQEFAGHHFTGSLRPYLVSPRREVPAHIPRPDYADHPEGLYGVLVVLVVNDCLFFGQVSYLLPACPGIPLSEMSAKSGAAKIRVHTPEQIEIMRTACKVRFIVVFFFYR